MWSRMLLGYVIGVSAHSASMQWKSARVCTREIIGIYLFVFVCFDIGLSLSDNLLTWRYSWKFYYTVKLNIVLLFSVFVFAVLSIVN